MAEGQRLLERSAGGPDLTEYHLEAAIAAVHASAPRLEDTNWAHIVWLYDMLLALRPSPGGALNRAIALAQRDGPEPGLAAIAAIADRDRLANYPFYHAALGELELRRGQGDAARGHFAAALALARNATERHFLAQRIEACAGGGGAGACSCRRAAYDGPPRGRPGPAGVSPPRRLPSWLFWVL